MICFPNAKINLGLRITGKRSDGFHDLSSFFLPVDLCDILEIIPSRGSTEIHMTGIEIPGSPDHNLCIQAWKLLRSKFRIPGVSIFLHKVVPLRSGLGGGSSDAAYSLMMLNEMFGIGLSDGALFDFAMQLGSDCGFFIQNKPALVQGRGDVINLINWPYPGLKILLLQAPLAISTAAAFQSIGSYRKTGYQQLPALAKWKDAFSNDFESYAFHQFPILQSLVDMLYSKDALYAGMTGSGSAIYGIFQDRVPELELPPDIHHFMLNILS